MTSTTTTPAERRPPAVALSGVTKVYGRGSRTPCSRWTGSRSTSRPASSSAWSARPAAARAPCSSWSPGWTGPAAASIERGRRRGTPALMFQEPALFPWLTVAGNVELPLKLRGVPRAERRRAGRRAAARRCTWPTSPQARRTSSPAACASGSRWPARSPWTAPVLLMDEPFGALDAMTRDLLHDELERIWTERELTVLFVTHNVREAARLGRPDRPALQPARPGHLRAPRSTSPRPRRIDSAEVAALAAEVTDRLRTEVGRHGH